MLVVLRSDLRSNVNLVSRIARLVRLQAVGVDDTGSFDFQLDRAVERKVEVEPVFVVGDRADGRDDQFSIARDVDSHVSEVGVLVQDTSVLFTVKLSVAAQAFAFGET